MKKILLMFGILLMAQAFGFSAVFADEIIDSKGNITDCKIVTVAEGLIEFKKDGCLYSFRRLDKDPVFGDYVDVKKNLFKDVVVERISGHVYCKNFGGVIVKIQDEVMNIPWYRVQNTGMYKPN